MTNPDNDQTTDPSQPQPAETRPAEAPEVPDWHRRTPDHGLAPDEDGVQHFEGTVIKVDADGNEVMSSTLAPGERLRREVTDQYTAVKPVK